jgi:glutathione synthase/RimK-type ligase-like ATP-grasp enzyme
MILVWSVRDDRSAAAVLAALEALSEPVRFLDRNQVPDQDPDGGLENVTAAYIRPRGRSLRGTEAVRFEQSMLSWADRTPALVVNRPSATASARSGACRPELIRGQGFAVPETLVTDDNTALEEFWDRHGRIVCRSAAGGCAFTAYLAPARRGKFRLGTGCPGELQPWIRGEDFRVHVVGDEVFACEIAPSAAGYRYPRSAGEAPGITPRSIPAEVETRCLRVAAALRLPLAGIGLRRTPEGEWFCLEVDSSPDFMSYGAAIGRPVAAALGRLLAGVEWNAPRWRAWAAADGGVAAGPRA